MFCPFDKEAIYRMHILKNFTEIFEYVHSVNTVRISADRDLQSSVLSSVAGISYNIDRRLYIFFRERGMFMKYKSYLIAALLGAGLMAGASTASAYTGQGTMKGNDLDITYPIVFT